MSAWMVEPSRTVLQQGQRLLRARAGDDRNRGDVGGLIAEGDAETHGENEGKSEYPENHFGLTLKLQQARGEQMGVARPAVIARRQRGSRILRAVVIEYSFACQQCRLSTTGSSVVGHLVALIGVSLLADGGRSVVRRRLPGWPGGWSGEADSCLPCSRLRATREWSGAAREH